MRRGRISDDGLKRVAQAVIPSKKGELSGGAADLAQQPVMRATLDAIGSDEFEYFFVTEAQPGDLKSFLMSGRIYDFDVENLFLEMVDVDSYEFWWPRSGGTARELMTESVATAVAELLVFEGKTRTPEG